MGKSTAKKKKAVIDPKAWHNKSLDTNESRNILKAANKMQMPKSQSEYMGKGAEKLALKICTILEPTDQRWGLFAKDISARNGVKFINLKK
jgi:hypothetical protein